MATCTEPTTASPTALELQILRSIAGFEPIAQILADICKGTEELVPGAIVGVSILDRAARVFESAVFPSLGESFETGIKGARVADKPGTCAVAIYNGQVVTSENVANDNRFWNEWRALNLQHGVKAIQSRPFFGPEKNALGTFVVGFRETVPADRFDDEAFLLGTRLAGLAMARHRNDERSSLLIGELQHRTRNLFTSINAIFRLSLKNSSSLQELQHAFEGRVSALSQAQTLATEPGGADLAALINSVAAPYARPHNVFVSGPALSLSPDAAAAFALSLHELCTNAAKYGAFTSDRGKVNVTWQAAPPETAGGRFKLVWEESGGPEVSAPTKSGFGRRTIRNSLARAVDAKISLEFKKEGLVCTIDAPIEQMTRLAID